MFSETRLTAAVRGAAGRGAALHIAAAGLGAAVMLASAGCTGTDEASAAGLAHDDAASAMATQLGAGAATSYTATYQLTGGRTATLVRAQDPARTAYRYPGGRLIVTPVSTVRCTGDTTLTCRESPSDPTAAATLSGTPLITPEAALAMLNAAALDSDVGTKQHDTTVAGRHANCLDLSRVDGTPAAAFTVCVTNDGALAGFTATIAGTTIDQQLTAFTDTPEPDAFTLPPSTRRVAG